MKKYVATCKSYGFQNKYWEEGEIMFSEDGEGVHPKLFKLIDEIKDDVDQLPNAVLSVKIKPKATLKKKRGAAKPLSFEGMLDDK